MTIFFYKAKEGPGKIISGTIEADNREGAVTKVIQMGLVPIDISIQGSNRIIADKKIRKSNFNLFKRVKLMDVVLFTRQMSDLIDASVPILRSLQIVSNQTQNAYLKEIISQMYSFVRDGGSFSNALAQHPGVFSNLYINMVKTGEVGGQLEVVLARLADYLEKEQETISKVKSSLAYPILILIVGILTVFVLLSFVIPRLSVMFEDFNQSLPLPTVFLTSISSFFAKFWWLIIIIILFSGLYFKRWLDTPNGRMIYDVFKLKIPILGNFIRIVEIGRFARTLGALMESGVVITTALNSVSDTVENVALKNQVKKLSEDVTNGSSLKDGLKKCSFFPEAAVNMISVGEETGRLERGLNKIADTYERESDRTIKTLVSLLGPIVLVFIVSIVGFVVIAMLLPIFQMNLLIQ